MAQETGPITGTRSAMATASWRPSSAGRSPRVQKGADQAKQLLKSRVSA